MPNDIKITSSVLVDVPGLATIISPTFDISAFTQILVDAVTQRIGAVDSSLFIRLQQSNDGVLWHDPLFVGVINTSAGTPRPRVVTAATPTRKFMRVTFVSQNANPTNLDYTVMGKTNA
jgi:hypothetical protein